MRWWSLLIFIFLSTSALAQDSARRATNKAEMLKRAEDLRVLATRAQDALRTRIGLEACTHIEGLFRGLPQHLTGIMAHMDNFDPRVAEMKNQSLDLLRETHKLHNTCLNGSLNPVSAREHLSLTQRLLGSHQALIRSRPTDFNNTYYYHYEF